MSALAQLEAKWAARLAEWRALGVVVDGGRVAAEIAADLAALRAEDAAETVTLTEAAVRSGYSVDHLQRLVAAGEIENAGRKGKPRIRVSDIPRKPGHSLRADNGGRQFTARRQIVASVTTGEAS